MNKIEKTIVGLIAICMLASVAMVINVMQKAGPLGGMSQSSGHFSTLGNTGVSTGVLVTSTSAQVLATSSAREYAEITNFSGIAIFCNANGDAPAVLYKGITIFSSSTARFGQDIPYTGAIQCIATGNASTTIYAKQ